MQGDNNLSGMLVVIVNYFNDDEVCSFIKNELLTQDLRNFEIYVVNNGSQHQDKFADRINEFQATLLNTGKNLGYLNGFLHAINHYHSIHNRFPELAILSNSDLFLQNNSLLKEIYSSYRNTGYACIGPSIISTRHHINQNPFMSRRVTKEKLLRLKFVDSIYIIYVLYQLTSILRSKLKRIGSMARSSNVSGPVYALHGSFIIFSAGFFKKAFADFKDSPFLFGEEIFIAEVALKNNLELYYDSKWSILHDEHATTGTFKSRKTIKYEQESITQIIKRFFS